jgi:ribosomal 30S subunit maturation factor RimM
MKLREVDTMTEFEKDCNAQVKDIAEELDIMGEDEFYEYITDVFDIEYHVSNEKEYRGVTIMVTAGGPNVYIDTCNKAVELYWSSTTAEYPISKKACERIDNLYEELWDC